MHLDHSDYTYRRKNSRRRGRQDNLCACHDFYLAARGRLLTGIAAASGSRWLFLSPDGRIRPDYNLHALVPRSASDNFDRRVTEPIIHASHPKIQFSSACLPL